MINTYQLNSEDNTAPQKGPMIGQVPPTHEHCAASPQIYKKTTVAAALIQTQINFGDGDNMQKLIIFAAVVACGFAAPVENDNSASLSRPSPINPDVPSDPKPEERVVLISTEKPVSVENPAIQPLGPYALPGPTKRFLKRENKDSSSSSSSEENSSEEAKKPATTVLKQISHSLPSTSAEEKPATQSPGTPVDDSSKTTSTTAPHRKPYSPKIHQHNEHLFKPTTEAGASTSPAVVADVASNDKRDIPVASPQKADSDAAKEVKPKEEVKQDAAPKAELTHSSHPATISRPIPVAELFAKKPPTPSAASTE